MKKLYELIDNENIVLIDDEIPHGVKGLYFDNVIILHNKIETSNERNCVLAEELGHHFTSSKNILDTSLFINKKQEDIARRWAVEQLIKPNKLIDAFKAGIRNRWELSQFLDVTEVFIDDSLVHLKKLHGERITIGEYTINFDPLWVYKSFE